MLTEEERSILKLLLVTPYNKMHRNDETKFKELINKCKWFELKDILLEADREITVVNTTFDQ